MYLIVGTIYFLQDVSEAPTIHAVTPRTTITYTRTVSKNVILAWNFNKCT